MGKGKKNLKEAGKGHFLYISILIILNYLRLHYDPRRAPFFIWSNQSKWLRPSTKRTDWKCEFKWLPEMGIQQFRHFKVIPFGERFSFLSSINSLEWGQNNLCTVKCHRAKQNKKNGTLKSMNCIFISAITHSQNWWYDPLPGRARAHTHTYKH